MIDPKNIDLTDFLVTWYGPPVRNLTPLPDSCDWLPSPLKEWHTLITRWDARITYTTSMIAPTEIHISDDGKAIFMVDATCDWRWCFDPNNPDTVFDAEFYDPWEKNPEELADFLVHNTVREVVYGATAKMQAFDVPGETLTQILAPMKEVAFGAWRWPTPGYRIFMGDDSLAEIIKDEHGPGWYVEIVAPEYGPLSRLENISGVNWRTREA